MSNGNMEELSFDVVVVGGGTAGLAAAIASARKGAKTAIVQDRPVFGGNSSSEIRVAPLGAATFNGWARETGIMEEWLTEERSRNHDDVFDGMANSHYDMVLWESAKSEPHLTTFMNTSVRNADTEMLDDGRVRIAAAYASQLASEKEFCFRAHQFIDCTGDATLGVAAGADFRYGREARGEHNENMAPVEADEQTMGATLTMRARNVGHPVPFSAPAWACKYRTQEDIGLLRPPNRFNRKDYSGWWWMEIGTPYHQIDDNQAIRDELLAHVMGVWDYIKNYGPDRNEAAEYALEWVGMVPGKRESRRLMGDVIVTEDDCHSDKVWPDRVCYSGWFIDLHTMGGILKKDEPGEPAHADDNYRYWARVAPFSLPLRCLYSRNVANLWMAGRNISVTHVALGSTRVMMTHALQGQAVGAASAYAASTGLDARAIADPEGEHISSIQQQLLRDDVHLFDLPNQDPDDLARGAAVTADSQAALDFGEPLEGAELELTVPLSQMIPMSDGRLDRIAVYLRNALDHDKAITGRICQQERIWDRDTGPNVAEFECAIPAGSAGWQEICVNTRTAENKPCRIMLNPAPGIFWSRASLNPTGTTVQHLHTCTGGCLPGNEHMDSLKPEAVDLPPYALWTQHRHMALAVRVSPAPQPYSADNITNGVAWPLTRPNLWVSDPRQSLPQSAVIDLGAEREFNTVILSFDTHLDYAYKSMGRFWKAHSCAKDWKLYARIGNQWKEIHSEQGNYNRRRTITFETVCASALRVEVLSTNIQTAQAKPNTNLRKTAEMEHARSARIYEVRVYNKRGNL